MLHRGAFRSSKLERLSGYAELLLENYKEIAPGDVMLLFQIREEIPLSLKWRRLREKEI